jgi:hypothetical protein
MYAPRNGHRVGVGPHKDGFSAEKGEVVVEVKMTRRGLDQKGVLKELTEDIERYRSHWDCKTLVCFVYDPSAICSNPASLENDLTGPRGALNVIVHVGPKTRSLSRWPNKVSCFCSFRRTVRAENARFILRSHGGRGTPCASRRAAFAIRLLSVEDRTRF